MASLINASSFHLPHPVGQTNWHLFLAYAEKTCFRLSKKIFLQGAFQILNGEWASIDFMVPQNDFANGFNC